jgi:hypothetical protein
VTERGDYVQETAELNARLRDLVTEAEVTAEAAIESRQVEALTESLRATLGLLSAVVDDLTRGRAEGAYGYARDPEFRRLVDRLRRA